MALRCRCGVSYGFLTAAFLVCLPWASHAGPVKFMSYNVLEGWDRARGDRLVAVIEDQAPDVLGLQEIVGGDIDYLYGRLAEEFSIHFADTLDPMLVRKDSGLRLIEQGTSELFRCFVDRQVNWIRLEETESG